MKSTGAQILEITRGLRQCLTHQDDLAENAECDSPRASIAGETRWRVSQKPSSLLRDPTYPLAGESPSSLPAP